MLASLQNTKRLRLADNAAKIVINTVEIVLCGKRWLNQPDLFTNMSFFISNNAFFVGVFLVALDEIKPRARGGQSMARTHETEAEKRKMTVEEAGKKGGEARKEELGHRRPARQGDDRRRQGGRKRIR